MEAETYGLQPLATLDDDEVAVAALSEDEHYELLIYAIGWDRDAAAARDAVQQDGSVLIPWVVLTPIALASIVILVFAWFVW